MGSQLYDPVDPRARERALDDRTYALDHFPAKLLQLTAGFQTVTGKRLAQERRIALEDFYDRFLAELQAEN